MNLPSAQILAKELRSVRIAARVCRYVLPGIDVSCLYDTDEKETKYAKRLKALSINLIRLETYTAAKCLDKRGRYIKLNVLHRDVLVFSTLRSQDRVTMIKDTEGNWDWFPLAPLHSKKGRDQGGMDYIDDEAVTPDSLEDDASDLEDY